MNYFEFYETPVSFILDEKKLKRQFYQKSKALHPDFFTLESADKQAAALELSTFNNEAYKVLSDFDSRMEYILKLRGFYEEEGQNKVPQDFLMEVMEINEAIMELEFDYDETAFQRVKKEANMLETKLLEEIMPTLESYNDVEANEELLKKIKKFYLKRKYFLRIQKSLSIFASL